MATKRMFSLQIVDTDAFLDMPASAQLLYFHLCMRADDEGFVGNPKKIMRIIGASDDDYKILIVKRFVLIFESAVMVIKHWLIHNTIRMDRFGGTTYHDEKAQLEVKKNKSYTLKDSDENDMATSWQPVGNQLEPQVKLSKVKLSKDNATDEQEEESVGKPDTGIVAIINAFKEVNTAYAKWFANKTQRAAAQRLIDQHGLDHILAVIAILNQTNAMPYVPTVTTPDQLENKWAALEATLRRKKTEIKSKGRGLEV
jgi:hypothetical protein